MAIKNVRRGDFVSYRGSRYRWGTRSGRYQTLTPVDGRGSSVLVMADKVSADVYPGPDNSGIFDSRHANIYEVVRPDVSIRVTTLRVAPDSHIGVVDVRRKPSPEWTGPLSTELPQFTSEEQLLLALLRHIASLLQKVAGTTPDRRQSALDAIVTIVDQMPEEVRRAFVGAKEGDL